MKKFSYNNVVVTQDYDEQDVEDRKIKCFIGGRGELFFVFAWHLYCVLRSTIGDVRKCTDEEHSIWSGGSKIKDLAQCGWGETKDEKKKRERKVDKMEYCENNEISENDNINVL